MTDSSAEVPEEQLEPTQDDEDEEQGEAKLHTHVEAEDSQQVSLSPSSGSFMHILHIMFKIWNDFLCLIKDYFAFNDILQVFKLH